MKLSRSFLKTGKAEEKPEVRGEASNKVIIDCVQQAPEEQKPVEVYAVKNKFEYDKNLITPDQPAEKNTIYNSAVTYCESFGVKVAEHLKQAMELRADKHKVLSPREADICARGKVDLSAGFFWESMFIYDGYIQEGEIAFKLNPWEIRSRYNNGLHWKNTARDKATVKQKQKGDTLLIELLQTLDAYKLPAYPAESGMGFNRELCKPEFLSWEQYDVIRAVFKTGTEEHQKELLT